MSDVWQGPGWWQASDGRWYPPEQAPGPVANPYGPSPGDPPAYGAPPSGYPPAYGAPPPGYPPGYDPVYGAPAPGPSGGEPPVRTNGLAVASLVCSFFFWVYGVPAVLAVVFGFVARAQIRRANGTQTGGGLALAGIIVGFVGLAVTVAVVIAVAVSLHNCQHNGDCPFVTP